MDNQQKLDAYFQEFAARIQKVQQGLAPMVGTEVINSSLDNFKNESFDGQPWAKRKDKKNTKKLLIKSGNLRRSPHIVSSTLTSVTVGSDLPYAAVHNNGGEINRAARSETFVRNRYTKGKKGKMFGGMGAFKKGTTAGKGQTYKAYRYNMTMRKFLGITPKLTKDIQAVINEEFKKEFGQW